MAAASSINTKVKEALKKFQEAVLELSNVLDETEYEFTQSEPEYMVDIEDFAYEITTFVEDELTELNKPQLTLVG